MTLDIVLRDHCKIRNRDLKCSAWSENAAPFSDNIEFIGMREVFKDVTRTHFFAAFIRYLRPIIKSQRVCTAAILDVDSGIIRNWLPAFTDIEFQDFPFNLPLTDSPPRRSVGEYRLFRSGL